jgi:uncharacterized DUF497 family protein
MDIEFEWDSEKEDMNIIKHGVSFEEAKLVFFDPLRVDIFDRDHSEGEERWKVFGIVGCVLLMVCCTDRAGVIRIISARKATKNEEESYFYGYCTDFCI